MERSVSLSVVAAVGVFSRLCITSLSAAIDAGAERPSATAPVNVRTKPGARWRASVRPPLMGLLLLAVLGLMLATPGTALAQDEQDEGATEVGTEVGTEAELRAAWADPLETSIELTADVFLRQCRTGDPIRESARPMTLDGNGHAIRQTCFEKRVLRQDGTGYLLIKDVRLTRGGSDGPGAALTTRGEVEIEGSRVQQNLAEEPGGGVFSMRRITVRD